MAGGTGTSAVPVVKAEFVAMRLAARAGLNVATVALTRSLKKDVLLVERFDRFPRPDGAQAHGRRSRRLSSSVLKNTVS